MDLNQFNDSQLNDSQLNEAFSRLSKLPLKDLAKKDFEKKVIRSNELIFDWSKNFLDISTLNLLLDLAKEKGLQEKRSQMFAGEKINLTEGRAVLHTALRHPKTPQLIQNPAILEQVHSELGKMKEIVTAVHTGQWVGFSGKRIKHIVNVGIGGSFLGPKMMIEALKEYEVDTSLRFHFVANVDLREWQRVKKEIDLERALFILSSKSMGTTETLMNAQAIVQTMRGLCMDEEALSRHFIAVTANPQKLTALGIPFCAQLTLWDWVGGRFSLWSSIGLPVALCVGYENFIDVLRGAHAMDEHFVQAPLEQNMPVVMALTAYWYRHFFKRNSQAVLTYHHGLRFLPDYLQQLEMESNGKSVHTDGSPMKEDTTPILWGGEGTNGQHAYHQLLHQGTQWHNVDFIVPLTSPIEGKQDAQIHQVKIHQANLVANALAQSQVLMVGLSANDIEQTLLAQGKKTEDAKFLAKHKEMPGNRPSNLILMKKLTPFSLGELVALYEHRTAVLGWLWEINSFDQWGVELGKIVAEGIVGDLLGEGLQKNYDPSTQQAISIWREGNI